MKKITAILLLSFPFLGISQCLEKSCLIILEEYIEHEPLEYGFNKDSIILVVNLGEIGKDFAISMSMYELKYYPDNDSVKMYKGVRMLVQYPAEMDKKLSKHFKTVKESRIVLTDGEIVTIREDASNYTFQFNEKNEIYIMFTSDNDYYIERLKKRRLKIAKNVNDFD